MWVALVACFMLCACGSSDITHQMKNVIMKVQEVEVSKQKRYMGSKIVTRVLVAGLMIASLVHLRTIIAHVF